jgi:hypothetical protein
MPTPEDVLNAVGLTRAPRSRVPGWVAPVAFMSIGVAVGAAAAVLLTPKSGRALREDVKRRLPGTNTVDRTLPVGEVVPDSTPTYAGAVFENRYEH